MPEEIPYSWFAVGFLLLVILFIFIFPKGKGNIDEKQFLAMESRLKNLEGRIGQLDAVDEKITRFWEQAQGFEQFKTRFDRSEASLSLRMDNLVKGMDRLQERKESRSDRLSAEDQARVGASPKG